MADPQISTDELFTMIGRLYMESRARARNEQRLEIALAAASNPVSGEPEKVKRGR